MTATRKSPVGRLIKALASLKFAVILMVLLGLLTAWGTIVESLYDAEAARKTVYDTIWMYLVMGALSVSLTAVMVDRWPWKKKHTAFVLAHIGILLLLLGSVFTMKWGLDGQMSIPIGQSARHVVIPWETDLLVYASFGGDAMTKIHEEEVDFFRRPPSSENPVRIVTDAGEIRVTEAKRYVLPTRQVEASTENIAGPGVRFQIVNNMVSAVEWLVQRQTGRPATHDFGPAKIHLGKAPEMGSGENEIWLTPEDDQTLKWTLFKMESPHPAASGRVKEGELVQTGWMGLELRILRYFPKARERWTFEERSSPTPKTTAAAKLEFNGQEHWLLLNDTVRLFTENTAYLVSYINRRIDLGFSVKLDHFEMIPYEGTQRAKEYKSIVEFPELGTTEISMNEPAVFQGLTFYQASFQNDNMGRPIASVLSVNHDPGRWLKYLGSLVMSLGVVALFWLRKVYWPPVPSEEKK